MSLANFIGLSDLPPEIAAALKPILEQVEKQTSEMVQASLTRVDQMIQSALDRIDGAQVVATITIKLPQAGSRMAEPAQTDETRTG